MFEYSCLITLGNVLTENDPIVSEIFKIKLKEMEKINIQNYILFALF